MIGDRLREIRRLKKVTQDDVAEFLGVKRQTYSAYEREVHTPDAWTIKKIAGFLDTSVDYLLGATEDPITKQVKEFNLEAWLKENTIPMTESVKIPVLGTVRAGAGGIVIQEVLGYEVTPKDAITAGEIYYWLTVNGDSMQPKLDHGDRVLIRQQDTIDSGSYAAVIIGGEEGLVKKVTYGNGWLELHSTNPKYEVRRFEGEDISQIKIVGPIVRSQRKW